jgi:hypothetical protein
MVSLKADRGTNRMAQPANGQISIEQTGFTTGRQVEVCCPEGVFCHCVTVRTEFLVFALSFRSVTIFESARSVSKLFLAIALDLTLSASSWTAKKWAQPSSEKHVLL